MLYSEKHNVCIYQSDEPQRIVQIIKTATIINSNTIAVPCTLWNMQVMRAMGFNAISPILHEYQWQGRYKPFEHQKHMSAFLTLHPRAFNLADIGTGKTLGTLWAADYLMSKGVVKKAIILSPLSTLHRVWHDEVFQHFLGNRKAVVLHGSREKRIQLLSKTDADFYIINHDGLGVGCHRGLRGLVLGELANTLKEREDINMVIVDEGSVYKDSNTMRYKVLKQVVQDKDYIWWLTGTPIPNGPTDAWAQARIVRKDYTESYKSFQDRTMMRVTNFKWVPKPESTRIAANALQPAIRFHREECIDLPPCQFVMRDVDLTKEQEKAQKALKTALAAAIGNGAINAVNEAALRMKLLQVSLGAVYDVKHDTHKIDCAPRIAVMREIIEQTKDKILIFAPLTSVINLIYSNLRNDYTVEMINGEVSPSKRNEIFRAFQHEKAPRIIVADPRTMAHGLTLTAASTIIWYGPTDMPEVYTQANGRINRPGQVKSMLVVRLAATTLEREIYKRLDNKESMQGAVLTSIKRGEIE